MAKQLTLFECHSANNRRTEIQSPNEGSAGSNRILQKNTIFVENLTTIIINDSCSLTLNSLKFNLNNYIYHN